MEFRRRFRSASACVEVITEHEQLFEPLHVLTSCYEASHAEPQIRYWLACRGAQEIWRGDTRLRGVEDVLDLVDIFALDLYETLTSWCRRAVVQHGACLASGGGAVALIGESGEGKSTLAYHLCLRGADYLSDEWTLFHPGAHVEGIARPICGSFDDVPAPFLAHPSTCEMSPGMPKEVLIQPPSQRLHHGLAHLKRIVFLHRGGQGRGLSPLSSDEYFRRLAANTVFGGAQAAQIIAQLVDEVPAVLLSGGTIQENCTLIESVL